MPFSRRLIDALEACKNRWLLPSALPRVDAIECKLGGHFVGPHAVLRDDLMHPTCSGNKLRKLDFLLPRLLDGGATHVVTCGGGQSAHAAAVAVAAAECGVAAHLVLRGEPLEVPTGYALISHLYATSVSHVSRDLYGATIDRSAALAVGVSRATALSGDAASIGIIGEGGRDAGALLGVMRLVAGLAEAYPLLAAQRTALVVAVGTGTTAVGLALGIMLAGLPWRVIGVPVAAKVASLDAACVALIRGLATAAPFMAAAVEEALAAQHLPCDLIASQLSTGGVDADAVGGAAVRSGLPLSWMPRPRQRRFGVVFPGEVDKCAEIARKTGILLDPIYTLAAWEVSSTLRSAANSFSEASGPCSTANDHVVLVHTGGTLAMMGIAQRYPEEFA
jgi:D-cysteine desulfhydrase